MPGDTAGGTPVLGLAPSRLGLARLRPRGTAEATVATGTLPPSRLVSNQPALKNNAASGGSVSLSQNCPPCFRSSSASAPPPVPLALPAYSRASLFSISRQ